MVYNGRRFFYKGMEVKTKMQLTYWLMRKAKDTYMFNIKDATECMKIARHFNISPLIFTL